MSVIHAGAFRANPRYALVLLDRLTPAECALLDGVDDAADLYGVFRPKPGSGLTPRVASADTALLFLTLADPGPLPVYVAARLGDELEPTIARLVLDAVLEVEHDGAYVGGPGAGAVVASGPALAGRGRIGELSRDALCYGQELADLPEALLARRLYDYGRRPLSVQLRRRLVDDAAVAAWLGLGPGGSARAALDASWREVAGTAGRRRHWRQWRRARAGATPSGGYKLYVSPATDALERAIGAVASSLGCVCGVSGFKLGADVHGICRPDKLVVYFDGLDDLQAGAVILHDRLAGLPAHGVPFSAAITLDGLLSWGADPAVTPAAATNPSWRMWVTARLAEYLVAARDSTDGRISPSQFALERMRLSGIDTDTWAPADGRRPTALAGT